jgi:hypothetical protein
MRLPPPLLPALPPPIPVPAAPVAPAPVPGEPEKLVFAPVPSGFRTPDDPLLVEQLTPITPVIVPLRIAQSTRDSFIDAPSQPRS